MYLFLAWRTLEDRLSTVAHSIEHYLWGDSRARHTFLIACTDEHPLLLIEIGSEEDDGGLHKSMKLNIRELDKLPDTICKIEFIGETSSPTAFKHLIRSAEDYVKKNPRYNVLSNNCRTFVEYCIDQIPEYFTSIPRKHGSILEYYHSQAKYEKPGAIAEAKELLKNISHQHRSNKQYKCIEKLVLKVELPKQENNNDPEDNGIAQ